jgi:hypothetical protein
MTTRMRASIAIACTALWCMMHLAANAQSPATGGSGVTGTSSGTSTSSSSANPLSGTNPANSALPPITNNSPGNPLSGTSPTGRSVSNSVQPGQTGSPETQRVNALNQEYQNQQQHRLSTQRQRLDQQQTSDINQLAPNGGQPGLAPLGVGVHSPVDSVPDRNLSGSAPVFDRGFIVNDLRQQGFATEDWRVVNQNGRWWFWSPDNSWLYYNGGSNNGNKRGWVAYRGSSRLQDSGSPARGSVSLPAGYPAEDWRLVQHEGRWWFWTPEQTWMYFNGGRWNDYSVGNADGASRYSVGYRGDHYRGNNLDPVQPRGVAGPIYDGNHGTTTNPMRTPDEAGVNVDAQNEAAN